MKSPIAESSEAMDRKTIRSICDCVGEHLRQSLGSSTSDRSRQLERLLDEFRRRDREDRRTTST